MSKKDSIRPLSLVEVTALRSALADRQRANEGYAAVVAEILESRDLNPNAQYHVEGNMLVPVDETSEKDV